MLNIIIICLIGLVTGLFSGMTGFFPLGLFVVLFKYLLIDIKMHLCLLQKFDNEYVIVKNSL